YGADVVRDGRADLWRCAERALHEGGAGEVHVSGLCTICDERFYSHRRLGLPAGRQAVLAGVGGRAVRAWSPRVPQGVRGRAPEDVELLAATKYVDPGDMPALHAAGIRLVGENRSDALLAKQADFEALFTWDFIGHLQSRKVRDVVGRVRLIHAIDSLSAC